MRANYLKNSLSWGGLAIALLLLLAVNMLAGTSLTSTRIDLTDNQRYTLTEGSGNILNSLDEPVNLRFYLSQTMATRLPGLSPYATRVQELLEEYARKANGKIRLSIIDPEPFSEAEDQAVAYGLQGVPIDEGGELFYFGLVGTGATDEVEVIPFFSPDRQSQIEYDLSKLVYQLTQTSQPKVGLLTRLPMNGGASPAAALAQPGAAQTELPWVVIDQIKQLFELESIDPGVGEIPGDIDVLLVAAPGELDVQMSYAIDQFVLKGGRALLFVDTLIEVAAAGPTPENPAAVDDSLNELLAAWGVVITPEMVAADIDRGLKVQTQVGRNQVMDYPVWMGLLPSEMDSDDIVTAEINKLTLLSPAALELNPTDEVSVTPLIQTTASGTLIEKSHIGFGQDPRALLQNYQPNGEPLVLAARIAGPLKSLYADGIPEGIDSQGFVKQANNAQVIIVGDIDMLHDSAWVQVQHLFGSRLAIPNSGNGAFVINAVENLIGNSDLISVRSRGKIDRPFTWVDKITKNAGLQFSQKEQELTARLEETEQRLSALQLEESDGNQLVLSDAQAQEIEQFRLEKVQIRKDLRDVQHALNKDIEQVEKVTKLINIGLVPLVVGLLGVLMVWMRGRRQRSVYEGAVR